MVFTDDMYSYIPDESLEHSSQWVDENGNNTPAYNHKYWEENKDEIMARRRMLQAGADSESGKYSGEAADEYLKFLEESVNAYVAEHRDHLTTEEQQLLLEEYQKEVEKVKGNKEETKSNTQGDTEDSKSSSKSSSGSGGSSGSSSKSSSSSGKSSGKSGGAVTKSSSPVKSTKGLTPKSDGSKEKSGSGKEKSGSGSKGSADKSSKSKDSGSKNQQPSEDNSPESVAFSKIKETGYESGSEPTNSYASFIREIRERTSYEVNDADTGLSLWKEYRKRRGMDTSDALISKHRASAEEEISRRKSLQHGTELFNYYSMSDDMQDGYDTFNDLVLEHHGILGQKWGHKNGPPYPLGAGDHSASERKAGWEQSLSSAGKALRGLSKDAAKTSVKVGKELGRVSRSAGSAIKKTAQNTSAEIHKRREEAKVRTAEKQEAKRKAEQDRLDAEKRTAISSGDRKYADENFSNMTSQEIKELLDRADLRVKVDKYNGKEPPKTFTEKVNGVMSNVNNVRNWAETGINTWNTFAKLYNSFNEDKLPVIDGNAAQRASDERKSQQDRAREALYQQMLRDPSYITQENLASLDDARYNSIFNRRDRLRKDTDAVNKAESSVAEALAKAAAQTRSDYDEQQLNLVKHDPSLWNESVFKNMDTDQLRDVTSYIDAYNNAVKASNGEPVNINGGGGGKKGKKGGNKSNQNQGQSYNEDQLKDLFEEWYEDKRNMS